MPTNIIDKELEKTKWNIDSVIGEFLSRKGVEKLLTTVREETILEILEMSYRPHDSGYEFILTENVKKLLQSKLRK